MALHLLACSFLPAVQFAPLDKQKFAHKQMVVASTPRTTLRKFVKADAIPMMDVFGDPDVMQFGDGPQTVERVRSWIRQRIADYDRQGFGLWAVVLKESTKPIGYCDGDPAAGFFRGNEIADFQCTGRRPALVLDVVGMFRRGPNDLAGDVQMENHALPDKDFFHPLQNQRPVRIMLVPRPDQIVVANPVDPFGNVRNTTAEVGAVSNCQRTLVCSIV